MSTTAEKEIITQFSLEDDEEVKKCFSCQLRSKKNYPGMIICTTNYLLFRGEDITIKEKAKYDDIKEITKKSKTLFSKWKGIKILLKSKEKLRFVDFYNRKKALEYFQDEIGHHCKSESEIYCEEVSMGMVQCAKQEGHSDNASSKTTAETKSNLGRNSNFENKIRSSLEEAMKTSDRIRSKSGACVKEHCEENKGVDVKSEDEFLERAKCSEDSQISQKNFFEIHEDSYSGKPRGTGSFHNPETEHDGSFESIRDKDIAKLGSFIKPRHGEKEILSAIFPIPLGIFWRRFLSDHAEYSWKDFYTEEGHKDIEASHWEPDSKNGGQKTDNDSTIDQILETKNRAVFRSILMELKSSSYGSKGLCILKYSCIKRPTKIELCIKMQIPSAPNGDKYYFNERWLLGSSSARGNKIYAKVFFSLLAEEDLKNKTKLFKKGHDIFEKKRQKWLKIVKTKSLLEIQEGDIKQMNNEIKDIQSREKEESKTPEELLEEFQPLNSQDCQPILNAPSLHKDSPEATLEQTSTRRLINGKMIFLLSLLLFTLLLVTFLI
ncbi:unnamed protein product [Moneuplotes crassus]|uniref:VASt domain-containing protein n=1 Tax=Euplotes crassus TaxID=5936 RepID=A0AAD1U209_EUPCR|nr:unnamed protein product [Moneuplotes crassus]